MTVVPLADIAAAGREAEAESQDDLPLAGEEGVQAATSREFTFERRIIRQERKHPGTAKNGAMLLWFAERYIERDELSFWGGLVIPFEY